MVGGLYHKDKMDLPEESVSNVAVSNRHYYITTGKNQFSGWVILREVKYSKVVDLPQNISFLKDTKTKVELSRRHGTININGYAVVE